MYSVLTVDLNGRSDFLDDGQRIHVGAQRHDLSWLAAFEHADDAGLADAGLHLHAELAQMVGDELAGARFAVRQLRVLVDVATPGDDFGSMAATRWSTVRREIIGCGRQ